MTPRHFLDIDDLDPAELTVILDLAEKKDPPKVLTDQSIALLFEKPSNRTRVSMETAAVQLGAHPIALRSDDVGIDTRERADDLARSLSCYTAMIGARVFQHGTLERLASAATVPVVNLLSDEAHPCQALADLLTLRQRFGKLEGLTVGWVGDGNNVCRSLMTAAPLAGITVRVASPRGYEPPAFDLERSDIELTHEPSFAADGADAIYTDVWTSMGQEEESGERRRAFEGFTIDAELMAMAKPSAVFLHCLPAHRGEEVTPEVLDGPRSAVWQQAENRLHAQRGLLLWLTQQSSEP
ncbi:MAG TPA: ornithine carbamoyltransferase [Acidimicrobiales bacterium]|nr:ornithine carbamoyltransferase [Acidimicrobiales bacterium]